MSRSVIIALVVVLLVALVFSACTYVTSQELDRVIRAADSGSTAARLLLEGSKFWARYAIFLTILGISSVFTVRQIISRSR